MPNAAVGSGLNPFADERTMMDTDNMLRDMITFGQACAAFATGTLTSNQAAFVTASNAFVAAMQAYKTNLEAIYPEVTPSS